MRPSSPLQGNKVSMYVCGVTVYDYRCVWFGASPSFLR